MDSKQDPNCKATEFVRTLLELAPAFGLVLDARIVQLFLEHYLMLLKWNQKIDLTSIVNPSDAAQFHFLESLYAIHFLRPEVQSAIDVGSGAGFPGIPIAVFRSSLNMVLVEPQARKAVFLRTMGNHLKLNNLSVFHGRFQYYPTRDFAAVFCRAIGRFRVLLPEILRFGETAKQIFLYVGKDLAEECSSLSSLTWTVESHPVPLSKQRFIVSLSLVPRETERS